MSIIRELPRSLVEKIAAGEVVERPASVVKELVENAIDAGATSIIIDIEDGGKKRIAVMDDGCGMDGEDLPRSVLRHATSKLKDESDLWNIRTMGFRGEALAAIGAVSKLTIESKVNLPEIIEGARIDIKGGVVKGEFAAGCPPGTKAVVSDLFFNVPARQKFLRSGAIERGHVHGCVTTLALANPDMRFEMISDGRRQFVFGAGSVRERVSAVFTGGAEKSLIEVSEDGLGLCVRGFVAEDGRSGGKDVHVFLNKRPVRDKLLMHAISAAFGERLSGGRYPTAVIWIDIDPAKVDVNVHPTKREVRFAEGKAVHNFVMSSVRKAVASRSSLVARDPQHPLPVIQSCFYERRATSDAFEVSSDERRATSDAFEVSSDERRATSDEMLRPLGQIGLTYVVCEGKDDELVLVDQHAAHERLKFDSLKRQHARGEVARQGLLIPERVELGAKSLAYVSEHAELFANAGFEIEPFGGATLLVKSVPSVLGGASVVGLFDKIASELEEFGGSSLHDEAIERIFATVACHAQVRAGDGLSNEELGALIRDIEREGVTHCPHGRPAIVKIGRTEIEKWFKRS